MMIGRILVLLLLVSVTPAFAVTSTSLFTIPADDISQIILNFLFGQMEGVLAGGGSLLLGKMFGVFNSSVLALGGIVLIYTLVVSTLNTAHQGEVMGKWNSMWIPVRSAIGVALLLPKESGYSIVQIFVMWVILQGVGAADSLWSTVVDYINDHGGGVTVSVDAVGLYAVEKSVANLLLDVGCMNAINTAFKTNVIKQNPFPIDPNNPSVTFGGDGTNFPKDFCGTISWDPNAGYESTYATAIQLLIANANQATNVLIQDAINDVELTSTGTVDMDFNLAIVNPATNYLQAVTPATGSTPSQLISDGEKNQGWMTAGFYYGLIGKKVLNSTKDVSAPEVTPNGRAPNGSKLYPYESTVNTYMDTIIGFVDAYLGSGGDTITVGTMKIQCGASGGGGMSSSIFGSVCASYSNVMAPFASTSLNSDTFIGGSVVDPTKDPLVQVQRVGVKLLDFVVAIWIIAGVGVFVIALATSMMSSMSPVFSAINTIITWIVPLLMTIASLVFVAGAMLAYYVPLIPFLMFLFGSVGWMMSVIDAIVAAPIVALGLLHPEGHDVFGEAKSAFMLLVSVFLRPSLMIFGLITAVALCMAAVGLFNMGFAITMNNIFAGGVLSLLSGIACLIMYVTVVVALVHMCFKLVNDIPNRVLRWIGGPSESYGEGGLDQVQGGFKEGMGTVGQVGDAAAKKGMELGKTLGDSISGGGKGGGGGAGESGDKSGGIDAGDAAKAAMVAL